MREVATGIGVPVTTYREWEQGRSIRAENVLRLAHYFGISFEELSGEKSVDEMNVEARIDALTRTLNQVLHELSILKEQVKQGKSET
jgi:transcriptional regulator with XRE-family HTH domain